MHAKALEFQTDINDRFDYFQVLVVQEKHCAPPLEGLWKIPTGFILEVLCLSDLDQTLFICSNIKETSTV